MSSDDAAFFHAQGYLRLPAFHPKARLAPLRQRIAGEVKRLAGAEGAARALRRLPVFQQVGKLSSQVGAQGAQAVLVTPELLARIAQLAAREPTGVQELQLLLSPPGQGDWRLAGLNWHVDIAAGAQGGIPGIQAFFLLDDVAPQGGATLALAGSHRLHGTPGARAVREVLRAGVDPVPQLHALGLQVVEMAGRAGDVYLMDMRVLHTPSVNATNRPRLMATCRCLFGAGPAG